MSFTTLDAYLASLSARGAGVIGSLRAGASCEKIKEYELAIGCEFPLPLRQLWQRFDGTSANEYSRFFTFYPDFMLPLSVEWSQKGYELFNDLRASGEQGFDVHFPKGFVQIAEIDAGGLWINCLPKSKTYGAVYVRTLNSDPLERYASNLSEFFAFLDQAVQQDILSVAPEDDDYCYEGDVMTDVEALNLLARKLLPNCPAHDWENDHFSDVPEWTQAE